MTGLTTRQVQQRIDEGKINLNENPNTRSYRQIIRANTLTFFNFLNVVLLILVLSVGSYKNSLFMGIIIINTIIGIVQEIRAKKTLDDLAILTESKAVVVREGKKWSISTDQLVLDDVIYLRTGDQIPADAEVMEGGLEVNESLLTGEADNLTKNPGDSLYSGSFVTAGEGYCRITHVGKDNYAARITSEAKEFKQHNSELRNSLNAILKVISIIIVPLGLMLFLKQYCIVGNNLRDSVVNMVAAVLGMIPEGLVLLTSVTLTLGAVMLAMQRTLVQELYCIETLARVDTLCLDKTGTITSGKMSVEQVIPYAQEDFAGSDGRENISSRTELTVSEKQTGDFAPLARIEEVMGNLLAALNDKNATSQALRDRFPLRQSMKPSQVIPFSSDRKYSGVVFEEKGTYLMGAAQFLFPEGNPQLAASCAAYGKEGLRVLVLAHSGRSASGREIPEGLTPVALFLLTDVIREDAPETLAFFDSQGVDLKVISGDDPVTVSAIAKKAGLKNAENFVDATTIRTPEELAWAVANCCVFGRVTPQQKKEMVLELKRQGHTVAMTGDGVNDVLALKEADCSIVMAEGSQAAKNIANVVLLDSNFSAMPHIVNQGRRVINNIRTAASMFLIKTMFSVMLSLLTIFWGDAYPFEPIQMSLISICAVGIPTFLLAQENNFNKIEDGFLRYVFLNAFPAAASITGCVFAVMLVCQNVYHSTDMLNTACVLVTGWNYMAALKTVYAPLNTYRKVIINGMQVIFFTAAVVLQSLLSLGSLEFGMIILVFILMTFAPMAMEALTVWIRRLYRKMQVSGEKSPLEIFVDKLRKPWNREKYEKNHA